MLSITIILKFWSNCNAPPIRCLYVKQQTNTINVINNHYFEIIREFQCTSYSLIVCTSTTNEYNNVIDNKCFEYKEKF